MRPNSLNEAGFQPLQSQTPVGHGNALNDGSSFNQQIMANRKAKFTQHQASKSINPNNSQMLPQGSQTNHKVNLSTDLAVPQMTSNSAMGFANPGQKPGVMAGKNGKPITMAYDRLKGLTPVGNKSNNG